MLGLTLFLINTNGDDSFVWVLRLSVCFRCFSCWRQGAALLVWAPSPSGLWGLEHSIPVLPEVNLGAPAAPSGTAYVTLDMPAICYALKQSLACLLAVGFFSVFFFLFFFPFSLSKGLHHLPVFHSLGSRGKEWNKSTCCFYQVNLCDVAWSEEIYILSAWAIFKECFTPFSLQRYFL